MKATVLFLIIATILTIVAAWNVLSSPFLAVLLFLIAFGFVVSAILIMP